MIFTSKDFIFDGINSTSFKDINNLPLVINATLQNDLYKQPLGGSRKISEQQVSGRDEPYFYAVDLSPLSFKMTIALSNYTTKEKIREILRWLLTPKTYKPLSFDAGITSYFVIFEGEPSISYVGKKGAGSSADTFLTYIEIDVRTNSPYLFTGTVTQTKITTEGSNDTGAVRVTSDNLGFSSNFNGGDADVYPDIIIHNILATPVSVTLTNIQNGSSFGHTGIPGSTKLVVKGLTKEIYFETANGTLLSSNAYIGWNKKHFYLSPKTTSDTAVTYTSAVFPNHSVHYITTFSYRQKHFI